MFVCFSPHALSFSLSQFCGQQPNHVALHFLVSWPSCVLCWALPVPGWALLPLSLLSEWTRTSCSEAAHMLLDAAKFAADQLAYFRGLAFIKFTTLYFHHHCIPSPEKECAKCTDKSVLWFCCNKTDSSLPFIGSRPCVPSW